MSTIKNGLGGDGSPGIGLSSDAKTVSKGLDRTEIPTRTTLLLVQDLPLTLAPLLTRVKVGGEGEGGSHKAHEEKSGLHHRC